MTSRSQLSSLVTADGAHLITLDMLAAAEARDMLAGRLGGEPVAVEPDAVAAIIAACARLPMALATSRRSPGAGWRPAGRAV